MSVGHILAAVAAVALVGGVFRYRRRLGLERSALAVLAALALALYASGVLSGLPDPETAIEDVAETLGQWTYLLVGALAFLETAALIGLVVPGEVAVIGGGVVAGQGTIDVELLIGLVWLAVVLGDTVGYIIGHRLGRAFLLKHGARLKITPERLERVERYFERYGGATIIAGRFIGVGRVLVPFLCGSAAMPYRMFVPYAVVGGGLWSVTMCLLGYFFYRSFSQVTEIAGRAGLALGLLVAVIVLAVYAYRRLRRAEERRRLARWLERQGRRPVMRPFVAAGRPIYRHSLLPAARLAAPRLRFIWRRLTPGGLGIELTVALAVVAVGAYVFVVYAVVLSADPGPTAADNELLDLADKLRVGWGVSIVKVFTDLGATPLVATVALVGGIALAVRGQVGEAMALVGGFALIYIGVQLAKAGIDRPRPAGALVETEGGAWPSGHAAYSTTYVALAVVLARLSRGRVRAAVLIGGGLLLAGAVGLSRIYLRAHYWSDVAGGWALGAAVFGLFAVGVLVVGYLRQNAPPAASRGASRLARSGSAPREADR